MRTLPSGQDTTGVSQFEALKSICGCRSIRDPSLPGIKARSAAGQRPTAPSGGRFCKGSACIYHVVYQYNVTACNIAYKLHSFNLVSLFALLVANYYTAA